MKWYVAVRIAQDV